MRLLLLKPESSQLRKIQKARPRRVWWEVYDLQQDLQHVERSASVSVGPDDVVAIACWPGMRKTADLIPAWQDAMRALRNRRSVLEDYPALLRSLRFWRTRHPVSGAGPTQMPHPGELRNYLVAPRSAYKRPWREVLQGLGMRSSSLSYTRREVAKFKHRVRETLDWPELSNLIAEVERAMPDRRGRPRKGRTGGERT